MEDTAHWIASARVGEEGQEGVAAFLAGRTPAGSLSDRQPAHRQSRRDRPAHHPHRPAAGRARRSPSTPRPTPAPPTSARPTKPFRSDRPRPAKAISPGDKILAAARAAGADAIHPGYGFLSENAEFAESVSQAAWSGWVRRPPAIRAMGLKDAAKRLMAAAGVPVTPGYLGEDQSPGRLAEEAAAIGWPVLIKAVAGGGGKGMRPCRSGRQTSPTRWPAPSARRRGVRRRSGAARELRHPAAAHRGAGVRRQLTAGSSTCSSATARSSAAIRR